MTPDEVDTVLAWLAEGGAVRVPFDAPLFSDNYPLSSSVRREASGRYALETLFKEPPTIREEEPVQLSRERLDEAELRARLLGAALADCERG